MLNKRIDWIDALKGIGILLVMIGHCRPEMNIVGRLCTGCHMPIFMFAAGCVVNCNMGFYEYITKRCKSLLYPFVIWSIIACVLKHNWRMILKMFTFEGYSVLWFLSALFGAEILLYLVHKRGGKYLVVTNVSILLIYYIFRYLGWIELTYVYVIMRAALSFVFVSAGYVLKDFVQNKKVFPYIGVVSFVVYIIVCYGFEEWWMFDLHFARIPNIPLYFFVAFSGTLGFVLVAQLFHNCHFLQLFGKHSLEFMLVHLYVRDYIRDYVVRFVDSMWIQYVILSVCVILISTIIVWATNRMPWLYRIKKRGVE